MRRALRRYGAGTVMCILGAALLLVGTGASLGYVALTHARDAPAAQPAAAEAPGKGLELHALVDLDVPLVPVEPVRLDYEPPAATKAALPGLSVDRDVSMKEGALGLDASLDLAAGSHRAKAAPADGSVSTSSMRAVLAPAVAPAVVAATVFTLAGAIAYFWTSVKAWAARVAVLPAVALYAKISRAEVFDNSVRERIFVAIRQDPGLSASDLSRRADVSWGTTIYHLDVLEQTRMVTSIRKGRYRRYFENGALLSGSKDAVAILQNPVTANVVKILRERPGVTQKDLAGATNMSPQALHWHLARLVETGLVRKEREGRVVRHFAAG